MTYSPNIPTDLPSPSIAVNFIKTNFSQFLTVFANNHVTINDSNQGKHANVIFQQQVTPTITGNYDAIYGQQISSFPGMFQGLFVKTPQFLPDPTQNLPFQLTYFITNTTGPVYQTFLPGGYVVYFGTTSNIALTISLSPQPTKILCVIPNANNFTTVGSPIPFDSSVTVLNNFQFKINSQTATGVYTFTWMAIAQQ